MDRWLPAFFVTAVLAAGCGRTPGPADLADRPLNIYAAPDHPWESVQRVLLVPLANETEYPRAAEQMRQALAEEFNGAGRFEVVLAPYNVEGPTSRDVMTRGEFDELAVLQLARQYQAQGVMFGTLTQYFPYPAPRIGMSLLLISPYEGVVIAATEDLWDARNTLVANRARLHHYSELAWPQSLLSVDRALESPEVFRRYVASEIARSFRVNTNPYPNPGPVSPIATAVETDAANSEGLQPVNGKQAEE